VQAADVPIRHHAGIARRILVNAGLPYERGIEMNLNDTRGENSRMSKLTESDVLEIRRLYLLYSTDIPRGDVYKEISRNYPISPSYVSQIVNRRKWRHLKEPEC